MPMNPEIKAQWTAALRSGEYQQGTGYLNADGKLCCLGVLCEQAVRAGVIESECDGGVVFYDGKGDVLTVKVREWAGLQKVGQCNPGNPSVTMGETTARLAELNDGDSGWDRHSFDQIADLIDAQL